MQRHRVVDPVAQEGHVLAGAAGDLDDARLLIGADPGDTVVVPIAASRWSSSSRPLCGTFASDRAAAAA
jgi:hypothetical protein